MTRLFRPLTVCFALIMVAGGAADALARAQHKAAVHPKKDGAGKPAQPHKTAQKSAHRSKSARKKGKDSEKSAKAQEPASPPLTGDAALMKETVRLVRQGKVTDATALEQTIGDPAIQKLAEWFTLRHLDGDVNVGRYAAFMADNAGWPGVAALRRRAEARLWHDRAEAATVRKFIGDAPVTAKGHFALARVLLLEGDREGAARLVREAWRSEDLSERSESDAYDMFKDLLTRDDHRARMDKRIGAKDLSAAMRAARHMGDDGVAIVKACAAVKGDAKKAPDLLDAVSSEARSDLGYTLCRITSMMKHNKLEEAATLMVAAPGATMAQQETDEWWRTRRVLARKLLDAGQYQAAYDVTLGAAPAANEFYRAEAHFMAGWIALRYLHDPARAKEHFARVDDTAVNPTILARANYWRGRAAEALGDGSAMMASYRAAARYTTAYYGQLARARLGLGRLELRTPAAAAATPSPLAEELVRAADMLYAIGEQGVARSFVAEFAEDSTDIPALVALAELTGRRGDAHAMLEIGKTALSRGLALDLYAFPTIGIPPHTQFGSPIDRSIIFSVARTESAFDQRDRSSANAVGLMQVTPEAGRDTAKRFGVSYDWDRMVSDPVYNTQMGAAELSALLKEYKGSEIMTFAGYNAGRGRVRDWIKAYGDPRDPNVDPVDWVERIPFAETRNYVQRVMENLQVYQLRFEAEGTVATKLDQSQPTRQEANSVPPPPAPAAGSE
jgi:soluble lytic murein transglycosylase